MLPTQEFSIKDLETFTGIKAHTIRIWEQRYGILSPERSDTNIRKYTDKDLKTLLNVSLLNNLGFKISRIASMNDSEIRETIGKCAKNEHSEKHYLHMLRIATINYDEHLFREVSDQYIAERGMEMAIRSVFLPFLNEVGNLWLADSICPAQEHFVTALIRQKLFAAIDDLPMEPVGIGDPVVLYLPEHEIHEMSLIMLHFILRKKGKRSIFLGSGVPNEDLLQVQQRLGKVNFVSIFTTKSSTVLLPEYLRKIVALFEQSDSHFYFTGHDMKSIKSPDPSVVSILIDVDQVIALL
jgi:DNA-binding transcriptional MerR regulator